MEEPNPPPPLMYRVVVNFLPNDADGIQSPQMEMTTHSEDLAMDAVRGATRMRMLDSVFLGIKRIRREEPRVEEQVHDEEEEEEEEVIHEDPRPAKVSRTMPDYVPLSQDVNFTVLRNALRKELDKRPLNIPMIETYKSQLLSYINPWMSENYPRMTNSDRDTFAEAFHMICEAKDILRLEKIYKPPV